MNAFQTVLFLSFGAVALALIGHGMGGFGVAMEALLASPRTAPLLSRERISPLFFLSYTVVPLSTTAFPHITIFCLTARRLAQFKRTVIVYPICILAIWLPCVFLGVAANAMASRPDGFQKSFVPATPDVLASTKLISQGALARIRVTAPAAAGSYPYMCTFPGHWRVMNGVMDVEQ